MSLYLSILFSQHFWSVVVSVYLVFCSNVFFVSDFLVDCIILASRSGIQLDNKIDFDQYKFLNLGDCFSKSII